MVEQLDCQGLPALHLRILETCLLKPESSEFLDRLQPYADKLAAYNSAM
jgi:hypothetical protein